MKLAINVSHHDGAERILITGIDQRQWCDLRDMQPRIATLKIGEMSAFLLVLSWGGEWLLKDNTFIPNAYRADLINRGWVVIPDWFDLANDEEFDEGYDAIDMTEVSLWVRPDLLSFNVYEGDEGPALTSANIKTEELDAYFPGFAITTGQEKTK